MSLSKNAGLVCAALAASWVAFVAPAPAGLMAGEPESGAAESSQSGTPRRPPGAAPLPAELASRLWAAYRARGPAYAPRTVHLRADGGPAYVNRLIFEDSPYLLQHAHNPVDWYPWGPEAFAAARRQDKPIFLSIGYSTCHWCHVMEAESFDDDSVARLMNQWFVSIKVDREQRPDVDEVYMSAVQLIAGRGGWPMSSFLTSDGKPFFAGTYYPQANFVDLLEQVATAWRERRSQLLEQADNVAAALARITAAAGAANEVGDDLVAMAVEQSLARHDDRLGGFSPAPKFPHEPELLLLLDRALRLGDGRALAAVEITLDRMARGGIYDQVGGGFHRYSTDAKWLVPHFEKMLYSQAHLARVYLEAAELTGSELFERVARQTLDYVLRDLTSPAGAFYSATDADSSGREGSFFVWTPAEIRAALAPADILLAMRTFGVTEQGNFEGKNILYLPDPLPATAAAMALPLADLFGDVDRIRARLYAAREQRSHPLRDDKIVTAWNAMMITTLARAGEALGESRYLEAARRAADSLWQHNRRDDGRLWRARLDGRSSVDATLNDYAYLVEALVTLYDATGETRWLERSRSLTEVMTARLWDDEAGGFFMGENDHGGRLPVRPKSPTDGAIPSGNSVAVRALALLAERTGEPSYERKAEAALAAFSGLIGRSPTAFAYMLLGAAELRHGGAGPLEYGARGVVRARASLAPTLSPELTVDLDIAGGWHVNSDAPLDKVLVPTRLTVAGDCCDLVDVTYPEAVLVRLGFQAEPLAVFEGRVAIRAALATRKTGQPRIAHLELTVQACDDKRCLKPEEMSLELPVSR